MPVIATDNFNRTDDADLGSPWVESPAGSGFKIVTNTAQLDNLAANAQVIYGGINWPHNQYSQGKCSITGGVTASGIGVFVRSQFPTADSFYRAVVSKAASNNLEVSKRYVGVKTQLAVSTVTWADGDVLKLEVFGQTPVRLAVYQNGVQVGSTVSDSFQPIAVGSAGLAYASDASISSASVDDWEGGGEYTAGFTINKLRPRPFSPCLAR